MNQKDKDKIVTYFIQLLHVYDFQLVIGINEDLKNIFKLKDIQEGNLNEIEQEEFYTLADIIERLDSYHQDYVYNNLEMKQEDNIKLKKDDWDLVTKRYIESDTVAKVLSEIHPKEYIELTDQKEDGKICKIQDIINILDDDEKFYKSVCEKYLDTMSKEMLIKVENKILHIYIADEYIKLKSEGKININNYKECLDRNFEVEEYYYYQDLYNSVIKDEIAYNLNDLALFDDNGKWNFYISFEELKKMGYGFMVKDNYPLIVKYAVSEEKIFDFFNYFSLEQLNDFEETLGFYFIENSIVYNEYELLTGNTISHFEARESYSFNSDILRLACGLVTYEDFIKDYTEQPINNSDLCLIKVSEYFRENEIKDLKNYGTDSDEGLYHLSSLYSEIMDKLDIKYSNIYTEDGITSGKYLTTINFEDGSQIQLDTSACNDIDVVAANMESIYEKYSQTQNQIKENDRKNEREFDYNYN